MIISDEKKFVFLHNPKSAGTTVRFALKKFDSYEGKFWRNQCDELERYGDMAHLSIKSLKAFFPNEYRKIETYFTFGFVRHPIKRFFSGFNETHKSLLQQVDNNTVKIDSYKEVLRKYTEVQLSCSHPEGWYTHVKPQKQIFFDGNRCMADLILKIEEPFPKIHKISDFLGSELEKTVVQALSGKPRNQKPIRYRPTDLLSTEYLNSIVEYYSEDYDTFGYLKEFY
jgi:hypothetical protein